jgi:hypothetical protein
MVAWKRNWSVFLLLFFNFYPFNLFLNITNHSMAEIKARITLKGFSNEDLERCIAQYEMANLWMKTRGGNSLTWIEIDDEE